MTRSVLCAVDINDPEADAKVLSTAARLAALDEAQLDVITVLPDFGFSLVGSFFESGHHEKMEREAKRRLNAMVEAALGSEQNVKVRHIVSTGKAYEEILRTAKAAGSDLIVIGAHKPDFSDYLLGPNAARVVRHSTVSVYVVR